MRLYHFTARHHLDGGTIHAAPGIRSTGLLANHHPLVTLPAHVWLTADASWEQMWSTRPVPGVYCDRTEVRLAIDIPDKHERLLPYRVVRTFVRREWLDSFEGGHDLSAWWVFMGWIDPKWIADVAYRPLMRAEVSA